MSDETPQATTVSRRSLAILAIVLLVVIALALGIPAWLDGRKSDVVAYVHVARPTHLVPELGPPTQTLEEYQSLKRTMVEYMRTKSLLTRALRDPAISNVPLVREQADPVQWLQDNLKFEYPNDAEILEITLRTGRPDEAAKVLDAVVDAFFKEVVEKGVQHRGQMEERLKQLEREKRDVGPRIKGGSTDVGGARYRRPGRCRDPEPDVPDSAELFE